MKLRLRTERSERHPVRLFATVKVLRRFGIEIHPITPEDIKNAVKKEEKKTRLQKWRIVRALPLHYSGDKSEMLWREYVAYGRSVKFSASGK
jgi:hypothetical protein